MAENTVVSKTQASVPPAEKQKDIDNHKLAAQHHEAAAKHHLEAAKHHEDGNDEKANASALLALGHHFNAGEYQREDAKRHVAHSH